VLYRMWDDYERGDAVPATPQWQARSAISLPSLNALERQFVEMVDHRLYVGFSHAAFLLLVPQCPASNQAQSDVQRCQLMDVVATGPKLQVPRSLGKLELISDSGSGGHYDEPPTAQPRSCCGCLRRAALASPPPRRQTAGTAAAAPPCLRLRCSPTPAPTRS
jgi:hypothetical protein